ncbi:MAG: transcription termination factor NusA [Anaerolineales bacterium]|nr:transcription termination factor NusA [Anaerolineales bacterium]
MKKEFVLAFNEVLEDRQLPRDVVMEALEAAMVSAYRKAVNASTAQQIVANIDSDTGEVTIAAEKEVVDIVHDERTEVTLEDARVVDPETEIGNLVIVDSTPENFGRVAAQTARQVIQQRIREAERIAQLEYFSNQVEEIVSGVVQAISGQSITLGLEKRAEGIMPRNQQITGERFRVHDRVRALLMEVKQTPRGPQIILSRAHRYFLRRLLEDEVPEIYQGLVEIRSIAREPGHRSKVAVAAVQAGIDPVGACVGMRGVRIQAIVRELNDEKIDVIEWNPDPAVYIAKALSPARVTGVYLERTLDGGKTATVVVPEDQLSLAIGRDGQNARLAAKLTGWRIDIKSLPEAAADAIYKLQNEEEFAAEAEAEAEILFQIETILTKKSEGRPIMPEEYRLLGQFVDRVEQSAVQRREEAMLAERAAVDEAREGIPAPAFEMTLEETEMSSRWATLLGEEGYESVGDLLVQLNMDSDAILAINGIGPKAMEDIQAAVDAIEFEVPVEEEAVAVEEEAAAAEAEAEVAAEAEIEAEAEAEPVEAAAAETPAAEEDEAPAAEAEIEAEAEEAVVVEMEEEEDLSLEEMFRLQSAELGLTTDLDEDDEDDESDDSETGERGRKKKKKRKKYVEMEYDPDHDVMIVKRKKKRGATDWDEGWEEDW